MKTSDQGRGISQTKAEEDTLKLNNLWPAYSYGIWYDLFVNWRFNWHHTNSAYCN